MKKVTNLSALFILIYFFKHSTWELVSNSNILSPYITGTWSSIPHKAIIIILILYALIVIDDLFRSKSSLTVYMFSLYILYLGTTTSINLLCLEPISNFTFFNIYHPIPLEMKLAYLKTELVRFENLYYPERLISRDNLKVFHDTVIMNLTPDLKYLSNLSSIEISQYAHELIITYHNLPTPPKLSTNFISLVIGAYFFLINYFK